MIPAAEPPTLTVAPTWKKLPRSVPAPPPAAPPELGTMLATWLTAVVERVPAVLLTDLTSGSWTALSTDVASSDEPSSAASGTLCARAEPVKPSPANASSRTAKIDRVGVHAVSDRSG